ncbi:MAG: LPS assembly protein LptD [Gammaproteobacteria bacterium]
MIILLKNASALLLCLPAFITLPAAAEIFGGCDPVLDEWTCDDEFSAITPAKTTPKPETAEVAPTEPLIPVEQTINRTGLCPTFNRDDAFSPDTLRLSPNSPTQLDGDQAQRDDRSNYTVSGNVILRRADVRLHADEVRYNQTEGFAEAEGRLFYDNPEQRVLAERGRFWLEEKRGELENARFDYYGKRGRGQAAKIQIKPGISRYEDTRYTSCPENSNVWAIKAGEVTLDENEGFGIARNARLTIKDVPVLYTPFLSFPVDDRRKTGVLMPSFGTSDNSGFDLSVPYYLNIAPNYDMTFTPRYLSSRGFQINSEFRYLRHNKRYVNTQAGHFKYELLPNDKKFKQRRSRLVFRDTTYLSNHLSTNISYDSVSDKTYLEDLGDSLRLASVTHLQRSAQINYDERWWNAGLTFDDYQTVNKNIAASDRPYRRLPRFTFNGTLAESPFGSIISVKSEWVNFRQDSKVTGNRIDLTPRISRPFRGAAYEITPTAGYRQTNYRLDNQAAGISENQSRSIPFFSLDNQFFLERYFEFDNRTLLQTLKPRIYYLYASKQNQKDIPLFDTSEPEFTYRELFRENRFNGTDRMSDANQLAFSLTTQLLDQKTGAQKLRASIGQLVYFKNREVTLSNTDKLTEHTSDIAGELDLALTDDWTGRADFVIDPRDAATERANMRFQYHPGPRQIANLAYRYQRGANNQIDTSILWPVSQNWHLIGRWYYDVSDNKVLETLAGVEYESCCWGLRLISRNYIDSSDNSNNTAIMLQIALKGLTSIGNNIESILEDGILGFTSTLED